MMYKQAINCNLEKEIFHSTVSKFIICCILFITEILKEEDEEVRMLSSIVPATGFPFPFSTSSLNKDLLNNSSKMTCTMALYSLLHLHSHISES